MAEGFSSEDYKHTAALLRSEDEAIRSAAASNNHNIILAALDLAGLRGDSTDGRDFVLMLETLKAWPALPSPLALHLIGGHAGDWPEDWKRGNQIQQELPYDRIPLTTECEKGAGFWDRITEGRWRAFPDKKEG